jgi:hypothetical protein
MLTTWTKVPLMEVKVLDRWVPVYSYADASKLTSTARDARGMGSEEWYGEWPDMGRIRKGDRMLARVSYNGRVWEKTSPGRPGEREVTGLELHRERHTKHKRTR